MQQHYSENNFNSSDNWILLNPIETSIKNKIEQYGTPLSEWNIQINYGIKTGYNDAFIIDESTKNALIASDPKSEELIRPILRGKDIKRYTYNFANLWLIYIPWHFPLHNDPNIKGASVKAEEEFKKQYPAVYSYLEGHKEKLSKRNKAETGIRYEWYALQRWGSNYSDDFNKLKIIYPNMTKYLPFYLDEEKFYTNQKCFIITGKHLGYLTAFLNSNLFKYCFRDSFPQLQGGTRELSKIFFEKIPVKEVSDSINKLFEEKVSKLQKAIASNMECNSIEIEIDDMILDLYNLTTIEKNYIKSFSII